MPIRTVRFECPWHSDVEIVFLRWDGPVEGVRPSGWVSPPMDCASKTDPRRVVLAERDQGGWTVRKHDRRAEGVSSPSPA